MSDKSLPVKRKANSFTEREIGMACEVLNATLSNSRLSSHRMSSDEFTSLFRKFLKMRSQLQES
jgi:hypothetical protein